MRNRGFHIQPRVHIVEHFSYKKKTLFIIILAPPPIENLPDASTGVATHPVFDHRYHFSDENYVKTIYLFQHYIILLLESIRG